METRGGSSNTLHIKTALSNMKLSENAASVTRNGTSQSSAACRNRLSEDFFNKKFLLGTIRIKSCQNDGNFPLPVISNSTAECNLLQLFDYT